MKKAVIFDLDGTLINSLPDIAASMNRSLKAFGLPTFATEEYRYKVGNGVFKIAERSVGDRQDLKDAVCALYMKDYAEHCAEKTFPYEGVRDMLDQIRARGLRIAVLSNKDQKDVEKVIAYCFPGFRFDCLRGRTDGVPLKPDPAGALLVAEALHVLPQETWYCGDTKMDMQCGSTAGMETIGFTWGFRPREELIQYKAKYLADTPDQAVKIILGEM